MARGALITGRRSEPLAAVAAAHPNIETLFADAANPQDAPGTVRAAE
jgi:short-subunit dehydrogenase involved in D-alanine esterification of teichoic acids